MGEKDRFDDKRRDVEQEKRRFAYLIRRSWVKARSIRA